MLKSTCSVAGGQVLNEHGALSWIICNRQQKCWDYPQMGYFGKQDICTSTLPPPFQVVSGVCCFFTGSWYRGLTVLGGGGVRKDSFPPSPSPSNASCHAGYFLSAKRHKGSLWQCLNSSFPDCSLKASSTTGNRQSRACSQTSGNQGFLQSCWCLGPFFTLQDVICSLF